MRKWSQAEASVFQNYAVAIHEPIGLDRPQSRQRVASNRAAHCGHTACVWKVSNALSHETQEQVELKVNYWFLLIMMFLYQKIFAVRSELTTHWLQASLLR